MSAISSRFNVLVLYCLDQGDGDPADEHFDFG